MPAVFPRYLVMNVAPSVPRALLLTAGLAVGLGLTLSARQQPFKSGARTVAVYATVDRRGRTAGAGPDARRLRDLRQRQAAAGLGLRQRHPADHDRDDARSQRQHAARTSGWSKRPAEAFVGKLLPADKARIGSFAARIQVDPREFTSDRRRCCRDPADRAAAGRADAALERGQRRHDGAAASGGPPRRARLHRRRGQPMNFSTHNVSLQDVMKRARRKRT